MLRIEETVPGPFLFRARETKRTLIIKNLTIMRDLVKEVILETVQVLKEKASEMTFPRWQSVEITDTLPSELNKYMSDNNIPDTAQFETDDDRVLLSWPGERTPLTEQEVGVYVSERFHVEVCVALAKRARREGLPTPRINVSRPFEKRAYHLWLVEPNTIIDEYVFAWIFK